MKAKQLLIISNLDETENNLPVWSGLSKHFEINIVNTDERAIELVNRQHFDMAVIDNTSAAIDVKKLMAVLPILQTDIELVYFEGEIFSELETKVKAVFNRRRVERIKRFLILDSSGQNAGNSLPPFSDN